MIPAELTSSPLFGILLSLLSFEIGLYLQRKAKNFPLVNPLVIAMVLIIAVLQLFHIPLSHYNAGGDLIALFLSPATACLAISIYRQLDLLKKNLLPVLLGSAAGSLTSILTVWALCRAFRLDEALTASLLPKSVTTPIAVSIAQAGGGIVPITMAAVLFTGILGALLAPSLIRLLRIKNPIEAGLSIGASSHVMGTSKAVEIGEVEGAMSGIAIGICGIITVVLSLFLF